MTQNLIKINSIYNILKEDAEIFNILAEFKIYWAEDQYTVKYNLKILKYNKIYKNLKGIASGELIYDFLYILNNFNEADEAAQKIYKNILFYKILEVICDIEDDLDWGYLDFAKIY